MANYQSLKTAINAVIKANGNKEITGTVLNEVLLAMVNSLGAGYQFAGVATPSTNPGTPDQKVFYIASQAGTYTNFNGAVVSDGIAIFEYNGSWTTETLDLSMAGQVQSDWTETDTTKKSYIKHKPNIPEEQVQSDWTEEDTAKKSYIKHKPNIPPSANVDPVPTEDSPNAVSSGGTYDMIVNTAETLFGDIQDATNINALESADGKIYDDYQAGDIFFIVDNNVRKYRVALVAGTADAEHPVTISPVNFYYALNSADAINLSLTLKTVSTEQQSLSSQQKAQARTNIAAVSYDQQSLNADQQVQAQNNVFAKAYSSDASLHSGLGKVYLQKNNGSLTQAMINTANTVYVIQYDYTLAANITIPAGCTLVFDGGSISSGGTNKNTVTGNNTIIEAGIYHILDVNLTISGTWIVSEAYPEWFGAIGDGVTDDSNSVSKVVNTFYTSVFIGSYYLTQTIEVPVGRTLRAIKNLIQSTTQTGYTFVAHQSCTYGLIINANCNCWDISVKRAQYNVDNDTQTINNVGVKLRGRDIKMDGVSVRWFDVGIEANAYLSQLMRCVSQECGIGYYLHGVVDTFPVIDTNPQTDNTSLLVTNCYAMTCRWQGFFVKSLVYSTFMNCGCDGCGIPAVKSVSESGIYYPYHVLFGHELTFICCGAEICARYMFLNNVTDISIINPHVALGFSYNSQDDSFSNKNIMRVYGSYNVLVENFNASVIQGKTFNYDVSAVIGCAGLSSPNKYGRFILTINGIANSNSNITVENDLYQKQIEVYTTNQLKRGGTRPTLEPLKDLGYEFFDFNLLKPIYWTGDVSGGKSGWVDAAGTSV